MTNTKQQKSQTPNRSTILLLVGLIICVLAVGAWILFGQEKPVAVTGPALDPATTLGNFYMPAEFDPQDRLYLGGDQLAAQYPDVMSAIIRAAAPEVSIAIIAGSTRGQATIDSLLVANHLADLDVVVTRSRVKSMWLRDFGPMTVTDVQGRRSMVEFHSGERRSHRFDDDLPAQLAIQLDLAILSNRLQVEGGDLVTNGLGLCVLSTRVVDDNAGYRDKGPDEIVQTVASMLGFENLIVVPPLVGEPTGHVDMFCTFIAADQVVIGSYDATADAENSAQLDLIAHDLAGQSTIAGPLQVTRMPLPGHNDGVWRSYTNVVFANGVVLVPIYPDYCPDLDEQALALYRRLLPDRQIVGVDASQLVLVNGNLRCLTTNVAVGAALVTTD